MIKFYIGDLLQDTPKCVISHICNNDLAWGAGFVLSLARRYPDARTSYLSLPRGADKKLKLGHTQFVLCNNVIVANMIAQNGFISKDNPHPCDLEYLKVCLVDVFRLATSLNLPVHMPRIGSKLGGQSWNSVEAAINKVLSLKEMFGFGDVNINVFTLPSEVKDFPQPENGYEGYTLCGTSEKDYHYVLSSELFESEESLLTKADFYSGNY
jgi:hypothetical protein